MIIRLIFGQLESFIMVDFFIYLFTFLDHFLKEKKSSNEKKKELLTGKSPFASCTFTELISKLQDPELEIFYPVEISPSAYKFINNLLQRNPSNRISFEDYFCSDYLDLEHLPSSDSFEKGVFVIKEAINCDLKKKTQEALFLYQEGISYLLAAIQCSFFFFLFFFFLFFSFLFFLSSHFFFLFVSIFEDEDDEKKISVLRAKCKSYIARAEELQKIEKKETTSGLFFVFLFIFLFIFLFTFL